MTMKTGGMSDKPLNNRYYLEGMSASAMEQMMELIPGGFFVYRADGNQEFLSVNGALLQLCGCDTRAEFFAMTGNSFRGFVHPEDVERVEASIDEQIQGTHMETDFVEYRIIRRDGSILWIRDYGRYVDTVDQGPVFYVFVYDATEEHWQKEELQKVRQKNAIYRDPQSSFLKSSRKAEGKKHRLLVVEDNPLNRELLASLLEEEYDIIQAENGDVGIELLKQYREELALILLDVYMPECDGFQFLEKTQSDPYLSSVPVIVTTGSNRHEDEEKCLRLGATDFITKPYNSEALFGRIHNVIRLRETLSTLSIIEFDPLTGLYTMSAFLHHAAQIIQGDRKSRDLAFLDIQDFSAINSIYGKRKGDEVLCYIAKELRQLLPDALIARREDHFYLLCDEDARMSREEILKNCKQISMAGPTSNLRVQIGIYQDVDRLLPISILCERIRYAIYSRGKSREDTVIYYDEEMEYRQVNNQRMLLNFDRALAEREFVAWMQPKVDARTGSISGAEALVRWIDSNGNFISPGSFIPLFEREGLIRRLDEYVFRGVCSYQRSQLEQKNKVIPISVNLSRNSLFSEGIAERYRAITEEMGISPALVPIEITESAVTSPLAILEICNAFVAAGFPLHMDDFGTGYSSLSALATLPFDVVKLDKTLIDQIDTEKGNVIIRNAIETARDLGMQVVAEGVEEKKQAEILALMGCNYIQGYYYAPPKKQEDFDALINEEMPFGDRGVFGYSADGIIRMNTQELRRYLKVCKNLFMAVRILDVDNCSYAMAENSGDLKETRKPCYELWKRNERCENCISLKAAKSKRREHKFETFGAVTYSIYAIYLEVSEKPCILELMNPVNTE